MCRNASAPAASGTAAHLLFFPGQFYDSETQLSQNWHRDYHPTLGRYMQSDPIGFAGGINTYGYVNGNTVGNIDPSRLDCVAAGNTVTRTTSTGKQLGPFPKPRGWPDRTGPGHPYRGTGDETPKLRLRKRLPKPHPLKHTILLNYEVPERRADMPDQKYSERQRQYAMDGEYLFGEGLVL